MGDGVCLELSPFVQLLNFCVAFKMKHSNSKCHLHDESSEMSSKHGQYIFSNTVGPPHP